MSEANYRFDTLQVHAGQVIDSTKSRAVPIYQTTSYVFDDSAYGSDVFNLRVPGNIYTRITNPTTDAFEKRVAALEGGVGALATASGMAAILYSIQNLAGPGDEIISLATLYGGTYTLFNNRLESQFAIKAHLVDPEDFDALEKTINDKTKAIFFESIGNPGINIPDIERITAIAHKHGIPVVVDNTFGTPYLIQLKDHGVDVIVHSATKYIGGHGNSIGGVIVDIGKFQYKGNPRFPQYNKPDDAYHGLVAADLGPAAYITRARVNLLRDTGACLSPFNAFLLLLGLETLSLRVQRHVQNAQAVAKHLQKHPHVAWVSHPDLPDNKFHERAKKYFPKGSGAIFTFGVKGGKEASIKFIDSLKLFSILANVADAKSLAIHPAGTTHSQLDEEGLKRAGVLPELVRLSIGIEDINDIIEDIDQALEKSQK
ncbi:O-acetylhomoserine/O-acetylserine sulfhydrylase [Angomonas deanei]|uniref:Cys/Met metabolism PLP-dependent enzyme/DegT/DnrJ/EryC1/StrS aminotransferase family/Aminotransferase class I and II/Aminotransferase class-V, putative n=1 Tax=Angomonas deanei TaxID=59799 RepID=S9TAK5_9TRYP|nr:O-acetylhomoserine aminocarboxypropyltransferase [Angomonas deanei]EPY15022.1 O-acetylhomoserine/O-acetylserine sulfhydrylase [Angomonas deanei]CAD2216946.1 Cys/Met metabolism PLP-dependent enzyme/DegT/DnrJ/EryC1/StrS aminotransferase family/Aminotransferase class I and II/Aminotransferase class-V, putative [Angomonas deanei]|eukprot:EPY15022.1 O-acetylhomoserine/O-acetylserine sulfhydrylase [Angomonas deanei]